MNGDITVKPFQVPDMEVVEGMTWPPQHVRWEINPYPSTPLSILEKGINFICHCAAIKASSLGIFPKKKCGDSRSQSIHFL